MMISCFPKTESQLRYVVSALKEAGLSDQYEEQAHGESVLLYVRTRTFEEREKVKAILDEAGISDFTQREENAA